MKKNISASIAYTNIYGTEEGSTGYFEWVSCSDEMGVPENMPDIGQVLSMIVDPEIISIRIINTAKGISAEGHSLSGKKAAVELKLKQ